MGAFQLRMHSLFGRYYTLPWNFYGVPWNFYGVPWNFYTVPWNFYTVPSCKNDSVLVLNSFLKKDKKQYKTEVKVAEKILVNVKK